jgi:hypothetical protein
LNRPKEIELTDADLDAWTSAIEENMPHEKKICWPLLDFARLHGKMQVGEFMNKETGEAFKSCIFTKPDGTRIFVAFSATMGELTPKEIAAMKDNLVVVQLESGNYSLCKIKDSKLDDLSCGAKVEDNQTVRKNWDIISNWKGKYAVGIKDGKKGIVNKEGITVIEPIFDEIAHESFNEMIAYYKNNPISYRFLLGTFGEGLVCSEEYNGSKKMSFAFVDKDLNKKIVFDEKWKKENGIELSQINIPFYSSCHFEKGILKIDFPIDEYYGRIYEIDKQGNALDIGGIDYKEFRNADPLEDIDWNID